MSVKNLVLSSLGLVLIIVLTVAAYVAFSGSDTDELAVTEQTTTSQLDVPEATNAATTLPVVEQESFSFAAAGDFSSSAEAEAVLNLIAQDENEFTLALGDLGYVGGGSEAQWCDFVTNIVGQDYPFQLIAGNHDDIDTGDGDILEYRKCLPNRIGEITGDYAIEYWFDYKDMARFILTSPDINNYDTGYSEGEPGYEFTKQAIADAKANGIEWIILVMHQNCISIGTKSCQVGADIMNLALAEGVDIILQAHEHAYFRSNQWVLSGECPQLVPGEFNPACVSGAGPSFQKGNGTVLVISGAGGIGLRDVNLEDSEFGYFEAWNGANVTNTHGYSRFTISQDRLESSFVGIKEDFQDSFSVSSQ